MTTRGRLALLLLLGLLAAPLAAEAQPAGKVWRIGFLSINSAAWGIDKPFRAALHDLEYQEGKNVLIEERWADGREERLPALASELVRLNPDVLVTDSTPGARAAQHATSSIPIVMAIADDPVRDGLVKSLARPGGNTTGLAAAMSDLAPKRLQLLKDVIPRLRRVAVLLNSRNPAGREDLRQTEVAAQTLGVNVRAFELVREHTELEPLFAAIIRERPDGLIVVGDHLALAHIVNIVRFAAKNRLPAMYDVSAFVLLFDGFISYGTDFAERWRRTAWYVHRILRGARPADLPVEQPTKFELIINLKTAKTLGLTIPQSLLLQVDQVIE